MKWYEKIFSVKNEGASKRVRAAGFSFVLPRRVESAAIRFKRPEIENFFRSDAEDRELLIVKLDSLGDYILMRNFWRKIFESRRYGGAKITLVLSSVLKELAPMLDSDVVSKFLFVDYRCWERGDSAWRGQFDSLFKSKSLNRRYDAVMFPTYSHATNARINRYLISKILAREYVLNNGDANPRDFEILRFNYLYTQVVDTPKNTFEFFSNRVFFEEALGEKIDIPMHFVERDKIPEAKESAKKYVVMNTRAQDFIRNWNPANFARLARLFKSRGLEVFLCGSLSEMAGCELVNSLSGDACTVRKFVRIRDYIALLSGAKVFVGLDSGAFHLAVSLGVPAIMISGGISFFRFVNYPDSDKYRILVNEYSKKILLENLDEFNRRGEELGFPGGGVNAVKVEDVFAASENFIDG